LSILSNENFRIFFSTWSGRAGLALLIILTAISIYTLIAIPVPEVSARWNDPQYWADYPKNSPPSWVNLFSNRKLPETLVFQERNIEIVGKGRVAEFLVNYEYDAFPSYISLVISGLSYTSRAPILTLSIVRPDGYSLEAARIPVPPPRPDEQPPYVRFSLKPERVLVSSSDELVREVYKLYLDRFDTQVTPTEVMQEGPQKYLFGVPQGVEVRPLRGVYKFTLSATQNEGALLIESVQIVLGGETYGFMGTDVIGRDLALGLLLGFPISLFIGVVTSVIVTGLGAALGLISGYVGGRVDNIIQRFADFINNIPLLPLLIFLVFSFGAKLWIIIVAFVSLGWPGLTIVTRSIVLQLRESQYVESARAIGASHLRILARHIFPSIAPFILAQVIFLTPSFILLEAALSFLGLGDPSLPTWGQILELGFRSAAVYLGYWWWILPPGILIIVTALTFVMISLGLEPVINPRVRAVGRR
jgi:peptide/nickel transport system permease protein